MSARGERRAARRPDAGRHRERRVVTLPRARGRELHVLDEAMEEIADNVSQHHGKLALTLTHYVYVGKDSDGGDFQCKVGVCQRMDPDLQDEFGWIVLRRLAGALKQTAPQVEQAADEVGEKLGEQKVVLPLQHGVKH